MSEDLWDKWANFDTTNHPDIVRLDDQDIISGAELKNVIGELDYLAREGDANAIVSLLDGIIPGAAVRSTPPPDLTTVY